MDEFAARLHALMEARGIRSQTELAARLGLPNSTVRNWLIGRTHPGLDAIRQLVTHLGVSLEWLTFGTGPMLREHQTDAPTGAGPKLVKVVELNPDAPGIYRAAGELEDTELGDNIRAVMRIHLSPEVDPKVKGKVLGFLAAIDPGEKKAGLPGANDAPRLGGSARRKADR